MLYVFIFKHYRLVVTNYYIIRTMYNIYDFGFLHFSYTYWFCNIKMYVYFPLRVVGSSYPWHEPLQCTLVCAQRSNGCWIAPCILVVRIRPAKNSRTRDVITTRETSRVDVFVRFIDGGLFVSAQLLPVRYTALPAFTAARPRATIIETEVVARRILYLYTYIMYMSCTSVCYYYCSTRFEFRNKI